MRALILTGDRNVDGKKDFTGAFLPESQRFAKLHGVSPVDVTRVDISKPMAARHAQALTGLTRAGDVDCVAIFCHGWSDGMQLGFTRANVAHITDLIADRCQKTRAPIVALYACSTARSKKPGSVGGDGGFADTLRDSLCANGMINCRVDAHDTAGHTTQNPYVVRFEGEGSPVGGNGGRWIVAPKSELWPYWSKALRTTDLRFKFPFMSTAEIHNHLLRAFG